MALPMMCHLYAAGAQKRLLWGIEGTKRDRQV